MLANQKAIDRIPPAIQDGKLLIRGTAEWDAREMARQLAGCKCLSYGRIVNKG